MQTSLRKMGNSTGMILPKEILRQIGAEAGAKMDLTVEENRLIVTPVKRKVREGWAEAAAAIADEDDPDLAAWRGFGNKGDDELEW
jgi:antitoxin MazE